MIKNKVFISHANRDYRDSNGCVIPGNAISEVIKVLNDNKIPFWIDEKGLLSAKGWCSQIEDALNECNIFLYISSENANSSVNTANEIAHAMEQQMHIIPFKLDKCEYHKDYRLNLINLHFLKYYEDREKALRDLVSTIKGIHTDRVIVDTLVEIKNLSNEPIINGVLLSEKVLSIFNSRDIVTSADHFMSLLQTLDCASEAGYDALSGYITRLQSLSEERNYNVRCSRIERLISDIKEDTNEKERTVCTMMVLLKMYLYFCLDDLKEVLEIQKELKDIQFKLSFLEQNADKINDVANKTIKGAMFLGGLITMLTGKGGSFAKANVNEATRGRKTNLVRTSQKIAAEKLTFEVLKEVVGNIVFVDK